MKNSEKIDRKEHFDPFLDRPKNKSNLFKKSLHAILTFGLGSLCTFVIIWLAGGFEPKIVIDDDAPRSPYIPKRTIGYYNLGIDDRSHIKRFGRLTHLIVDPVKLFINGTGQEFFIENMEESEWIKKEVEQNDVQLILSVHQKFLFQQRFRYRSLLAKFIHRHELEGINVILDSLTKSDESFMIEVIKETKRELDRLTGKPAKPIILSLEIQNEVISINVREIMKHVDFLTIQSDITPKSQVRGPYDGFSHGYITTEDFEDILHYYVKKLKKPEKLNLKISCYCNKTEELPTPTPYRNMGLMEYIESLKSTTMEPEIEYTCEEKEEKKLKYAVFNEIGGFAFWKPANEECDDNLMYLWRKNIYF